MNAVSEIFDYLTDPTGLGFPLLISGALFLVIWLMNKATKGWKKEDTKIEQKKERFSDRDLPFKPL